MIRGRKRKTGVVRDRTIQRSRGESAEQVRSVAVAYRTRDVGEKYALHQEAGYSLGKLHLRRQACETDPSGISREQMQAGNEWADLYRRHSAVMGYSLGGPKSPSFSMVAGGLSVAPDPAEGDIMAVRRRWVECYHVLVDEANMVDKNGRKPGIRLISVVYGICIENWPIEWLTKADFGYLRAALNALGKVLRGHNNQSIDIKAN